MKWFFLSVFVCAALFCEAEITSIKAGLVLTPTKALYILSDDSYWEFTALQPRRRTWGEWATFQEHPTIPEDYQVSLHDWKPQLLIELYQKGDDIDYTVAANSDELQKTSYLVMDTATGKRVFGKELSPSEFMERIYTSGLSYGYSTGQSQAIGFSLLNMQLK